MDILNSLNNTLFPGHRVPRVNGWKEAEKYQIPRDCEVIILDQSRANEVRLQGQLDNRDQTQTILNNLGRFVAWAGSGSQAVTTGS